MFFRILKKDLKRKRTMNIILLMFIILATMFVASGLNNVISVWSGTEYYLDKAGVGDYIVITMGDNVMGTMDDVLATEDAIESYKVEDIIYGAKENLVSMDDEELDTKNSIVFLSIDHAGISYFDSDNQPITSVEEGHAYVSGDFLNKNHMEPGDKIKVKHSGVEIELILDGKAKDAFLGSDFMGNTRIFLNEKQYQELLANETIKTSYQGQIAYINGDSAALSSAFSDVKGTGFTRTTTKMCYVMEMIMAFIVVILSICLILVSFVVLKFSISFTISEEFREIGVMKAIGLKNAKIRSLYIAKYFMLAVVGALLGLFLSIPFGNYLMDSVSKNMVLGNNIGFLINVIGAALVILVILLFAYACTRKIKKMSPVDAVRSGQTGERYKKKFVHHISRHGGDTAFKLAFNDVITNPKRFVTIIISFFICTLFTLMTANTANTMKSDRLIGTLATKSDAYLTDINEIMQYMHETDIASLEGKLRDLEDRMAKEGMPCTTCIEVQYQYGIEFNGNKYSTTLQQGLGAKASDYDYEEGLVPAAYNEIAITPQIAELTGADIGDQIVIDFGDQKVTCTVTAIYQTMNKLGQVIRLHEDAPVDLSTASSMMAFQFNFTDHPSEAEVNRRVERMKELFNTEEVETAAEYCEACIGVGDTMKGVQYSLLFITLIVVLLVTILMERSFVAEEKSQIAILKAIGFKDFQIIKWHVFRFGMVSLVSVLLAGALSIPMTHLCVDPIFGMMGASNISYKIDVLEIFVIIPAIIFAGTVIFAGLSALHTRQIKSSDTANIE